MVISVNDIFNGLVRMTYGLMPVVERNSPFTSMKMTEHNLVKAERARIRGRVHAFRLCG